MSFPSVIYGKEGDEKAVAASAIGGLPLGQKMVFSDGREFVHGRGGGTAIVAGKLYQGVDLSDTAAIATLVCATAAIGATTLTVTAGGTAITANLYQNGFVVTASSVGAGIGFTHKIASNNSCGAGSTCLVVLKSTDPIVVATEGGTTTVGIAKNPYSGCLLTTGDTAGVNLIAGVACASAAASSYVWFLRRGPIGVFTDATVGVGGLSAICSSTVAGAVGDGNTAGTATAKALTKIGTYISPAASAQFSTVNMELP